MTMFDALCMAYRSVTLSVIAALGVAVSVNIGDIEQKVFYNAHIDPIHDYGIHIDLLMQAGPGEYGNDVNFL